LATEFLSSAPYRAIFGSVTWRLGTFRAAWFKASIILKACLGATKTYHLFGSKKDEDHGSVIDHLIALPCGLPRVRFETKLLDS
jgi:hypothetical protein